MVGIERKNGAVTDYGEAYRNAVAGESELIRYANTISEYRRKNVRQQAYTRIVELKEMWDIGYLTEKGHKELTDLNEMILKNM